MNDLSRRQLLSTLAVAGIGTTVFQRAVVAQAEKATLITPELIAKAEWIAGVDLSPEDRAAVAGILNRWQLSFRQLRAVKLDNSVPPALSFHPAPTLPADDGKGDVRLTDNSDPKKPGNDAELAFLPVAKLAGLLRTRQVSSVELTKLYLKRLKEFDPVLKCVVTLTEKTALSQAEAADKEIKAGRYRGPLHGVPWGAKDLIAYPGYPTTWGAAPYKEQTLDVKATVAQKLEAAGAVLVAKLTLGALAQGDRWFGGMTRNPWNAERGSSGSSAGSASATAAGLAGFTIGSETLGSIVSPCRECGTSGLRPTFGRVSRAGCMTLSWSMDKLGPIARSLEDCALVFGAIHGADGLDASAVSRPFSWPYKGDLRSLKVGYFEKSTSKATLDVLKDMGVKLVPLTLPTKYPASALTTILFTEAAAAFDDLVRAGVREGINAWAGSFRAGQFVPAVEYLRANRVRTLLMKEMAEVMSKVDLYVGGDDLILTNLTGHPTIVLPNGFRKDGDGELPTSLTFTGRLYGETELLAVGHAYQVATGHQLRRPALEKLKKQS